MAARCSEPIGGSWYYKLKDEQGLFQNCRTSLINKMIIYRIERYTIKREEKMIRKYALFKTHLDFYLFYRSLRSKEFHEIIVGDSPQKSRFDIDLKRSELPIGADLISYGNTIVTRLLEATAQILSQEYQLKLAADEIIVCQSHGPDKFSVHIILNLYHNSNQEAKHFFWQVIKSCPELSKATEKGIIDQAVYNSLGSLRIIGSSKAGVRVKKLSQSFNFRGKIVEQSEGSSAIARKESFLKTLVTYTRNSRYIPVKLPKIEKKNVIPKVTDRLIKRALIAIEDDQSVEVEDIRDNIIVLKRIAASYCYVCKRIHEHQNPYLLVKQDGLTLMYCRRNKKGLVLLNSIPDDSDTDDSDSDDSDSDGKEVFQGPDLQLMDQMVHYTRTVEAKKTSLQNLSEDRAVNRSKKTETYSLLSSIPY